MPDDEIPEEPDDDSEETFEQFYAMQRASAAHQLPDQFLQAFVALLGTDLPHMSADVTLFIGGLVVCGYTIDVARYHGEVADQIETNAADDLGMQTAVTVFRTFSVENQASIALEERGKPDGISPMYIHLRNADVWQGGRCLAEGILWRGRLASIDAWSLGRVVG